MSAVLPEETWANSPEESLGNLWAQMSRALGWGLWASLLTTVGWVAYRRLVGAMHQPLPPPWLAVVGLGGWVVAFLAKRLLEGRPAKTDCRGSGSTLRKGAVGLEVEELSAISYSVPIQGAATGWVHGAANVALVVVAICLSIPGTGLWGWIGLWGIVLGGVVLERWLRRWGGPVGPASNQSKHPAKALPMDGQGREVGRGMWFAPPESAHWPEGLLEHLERFRSTDGGEVCQGWVRVDFAPGERTAVAHIAFCPPFPHQPLLHVEQRLGPAIRFKSTQVYPYGVRIEVKREQIGLDRAAWVVVAFQARCAGDSKAESPGTPW